MSEALIVNHINTANPGGSITGIDTVTGGTASLSPDIAAGSPAAAAPAPTTALAQLTAQLAKLKDDPTAKLPSPAANANNPYFAASAAAQIIAILSEVAMTESTIDNIMESAEIKMIFEAFQLSLAEARFEKQSMQKEIDKHMEIIQGALTKMGFAFAGLGVMILAHGMSMMGSSVKGKISSVHTPEQVTPKITPLPKAETPTPSAPPPSTSPSPSIDASSSTSSLPPPKVDIPTPSAPALSPNSPNSPSGNTTSSTDASGSPSSADHSAKPSSSTPSTDRIAFRPERVRSPRPTAPADKTDEDTPGVSPLSTREGRAAYLRQPHSTTPRPIDNVDEDIPTAPLDLSTRAGRVARMRQPPLPTTPAPKPKVDVDAPTTPLAEQPIASISPTGTPRPMPTAPPKDTSPARRQIASTTSSTPPPRTGEQHDVMVTRRDSADPPKEPAAATNAGSPNATTISTQPPPSPLPPGTSSQPVTASGITTVTKAPGTEGHPIIPGEVQQRDSVASRSVSETQSTENSSRVAATSTTAPRGAEPTDEAGGPQKTKAPGNIATPELQPATTAPKLGGKKVEAEEEHEIQTQNWRQLLVYIADRGGVNAIVEFGGAGQFANAKATKDYADAMEPIEKNKIVIEATKNMLKSEADLFRSAVSDVSQMIESTLEAIKQIAQQTTQMNDFSRL